MKRILILLTDLYGAIGGIQTFNITFVRALEELGNKHGWKISVYILNDSSKEKDISVPREIYYRSFSGSRYGFVLGALTAAFRTDLLIIGHSHFLGLALLMPRFIKNFRILIVHGIEVWHKLPFFLRLGLNKIHKILAVSRYTMNQMIKFNDCSEKLFSIFPNTLAPEFEKEETKLTRHHLNLPAGPIILSVARLSAFDVKKGVEHAIRAMQFVRNQIPEAVLLIVGDGNDRSRLERLVVDMNLNQTVFFIGQKNAEQLKSYYQACDIFVLPSAKEGFGIVFLEAMASGKPVVAAEEGGIPEVVVHGQTGFLVRYADVELLANRIISLLQDEALRKKMGSTGKLRFHDLFEYEKYCNRLERILVPLLCENGEFSG